jgi:RNA polymerase sigma factor (sigma-70 family)
MASECALSPTRPCTWCDTDKLIADCPRDLASVVQQYCSSRGMIESFALYAHLGGECRRCLGMILGMCRDALHACPRVPREWAAEDVSQTLFSKVLDSAWDPVKGPLGGWLHVIISRIVTDRMKSAYARRTRTIGNWTGEDGADGLPRYRIHERADDPGEQAANRDLCARLVRTLETLPLETRQLVTLRFIEGYTLQAIAAELAMPLATVARKLQKALVGLRDLLGERDEPHRKQGGGEP